MAEREEIKRKPEEKEQRQPLTVEQIKAAREIVGEKISKLVEGYLNLPPLPSSGSTLDFQLGAIRKGKEASLGSLKLVKDVLDIILGEKEPRLNLTAWETLDLLKKQDE